MIDPRKVDKPLILYGYGKLGHLAEEIFNELKIPIAGITDKDLGKKFIAYDTSKVLLAICVATEPYSQVITPLVAAGWTDIVPVWDIIEAYPEVGIGNGWFAEWITPKDQSGIESVIFKWGDFESFGHYAQFYAWRRFRHEWLTYPAGFDHKSEPLPSTLADIRARQYPIHFSEDYLHEFGKADIHCEGHELKTIEDNIFRFQKYRPKISCACYHSRDALWKIEKFLMDNLPDYTWTFRLTAFMGQGAYITGIPNERGK